MIRRQEDPRANQKRRTRAAIVEAAGCLRDDDGEIPTVARAAEAAGVSRATAYRYFPTQEALVLELSDVTPKVAERGRAALESLEGTTVAQRLLALVDAFNPIAVAEETHFRRAIWVAQDTWLRSDRNAEEPPAVREGRRMRWLDRALEPLDDMPEDRRRRLQAALALTLGMDSLTIMKDVCGLDDEEALTVLRWSATALLRAGSRAGLLSARGAELAAQAFADQRHDVVRVGIAPEHRLREHELTVEVDVEDPAGAGHDLDRCRARPPPTPRALAPPDRRRSGAPLRGRSTRSGRGASRPSRSFWQSVVPSRRRTRPPARPRPPAGATGSAGGCPRARARTRVDRRSALLKCAQPS